MSSFKQQLHKKLKEERVFAYYYDCITDADIYVDLYDDGL